MHPTIHFLFNILAFGGGVWGGDALKMERKWMVVYFATSSS
jgi:hypothetical protein